MSVDPLDYDEQLRREMQHQELSDAQSQSQAQGHAKAQQRGPIADLHGSQAPELLERLTDPDLDSEEHRQLQALLQPYLSRAHALAAHDDSDYDDRERELLNENLWERVVASHRRGRLCTGPFLDIAQDLEYEHTGRTRKPLSDFQKSALYAALVDVRGSFQSLGDGTFFDGVTQIHVSSEVRRDSDGGSGGGKGLLSSLNPFN